MEITEAGAVLAAGAIIGVCTTAAAVVR